MEEPTLSQVVELSCSLAWTSHCSYLHVVRIDEVLLCTRNGAIFRHCEKYEMLVFLYCFFPYKLNCKDQFERDGKTGSGKDLVYLKLK
jgi:hypothetical protein